MLKKILLTVVVLLLILVVAAVVLVSTIDVNRYRGRIEQEAHDRLDRTLNIGGKLSLSLFPTLALDLPHTTLSDRASEQTFVSVDRARVSLAVLPLLTGRVQVGVVTLRGLQVTITRHADGTTSVDDLTGRSKPAAAPQPPGARPASLPPFEVGGIQVDQAQVVVHDEAAHNTITLANLNLHTGRLASRTHTNLDLSGTLTQTAPPTRIELALKTIVDLDLPQQSIGLTGLDAHLHGNSGADQLDAALTAPKFDLRPGHAESGAIKLLASLSGAHPLRADLTLSDVGGDATQFSVGKLAGELELQTPQQPPKPVKVTLDGALRADDTQAQNASATLNLHFDETTANSRWEVHDFSSPHLDFQVDVDRLNLDRYLPASSGATAQAPARGQGQGAAPSPAAQKIDFSPLKTLNLSGRASIGSLQAHNLKASKVQVAVHAGSGRLDVAPVSASLYQGSLNASARVDAAAQAVAVKADLGGVSVGPLLQDFSGRDLLEGHGTVKMDLTARGDSVDAMRRSLGGTASLMLRDGAIHGIDLEQKLHDLQSVISRVSGAHGAEAAAPAAQSGTANQAQKTVFSQFSASFSVKNGVATNQDLQADSPLLRIRGNGRINLANDSLDYTVQTSVVGGPNAGPLAGLGGVTIPVHLAGPLDSISYQLDWNAALQQAAVKRGMEHLKGLLGNRQKGDSGSNVGDALKGLLGK